jgi:hypothetical protein
MEQQGRSQIQFYRRSELQNGKAIDDDNVDAPGTTNSQHLHFSNALQLGVHLNSAYIMLIEDDFPLCKTGWSKFVQIFYKAYGPSPDFERKAGPCGIFAATGGSGILVRRDIGIILVYLLRVLLPHVSLVTFIYIGNQILA